MEYKHFEIEKKWRKYWADNNTYKVFEDSSKPKYYVLDMFPYPSGAGLHVGHPLGYIASDIYSRYKKMEGFNVLHPMGYDSFGLPAEQYAIQTGQHPALTTKENISRYRDQLDKLGFCFDWDREVRTSSPSYYKWTQWIFKQLYNSYFDLKENKAINIEHLRIKLSENGTTNLNAYSDNKQNISSKEWDLMNAEEKEIFLLNYRLTYLADSLVNWCPKLGTVLANDEVVNGLSVRGGFPVEQKTMRQWSMRIKAYSERLLEGLNQIDWTDSLKEQQRYWIGKSFGCSVEFKLEKENTKFIEVFTTRPDTIFGVSFMVLAPEHPLVNKITTEDYLKNVTEYVKLASNKSDLDRQSESKHISGEFTGAYAIHPFTKKKIPIWIGDYVLLSYGTGAVMSVPCGDQRDYDFAKKMNLPIPNIFKSIDITTEAYSEKDALICDSQFLNDLTIDKAIKRAIHQIEEEKIGRGKINYRLRDAVFSRQRYWGEPFPVYYKNDTPYLIEDKNLPIELPEVDKYLPTEDGEPPLARSKKEDWNYTQGDKMEYNTMPGWAGSSWYFLRYLDPNNEKEFVSKEKLNYWKNVDLYIGGSEHATGHLLYSRFWTKVLFDLDFIPFDEPFKKMINQGMILGRSNFVYRVEGTNQFVSLSKRNDYSTTPIHVDVNLVDNDFLDIEAFKNWLPEYKDASFILEEDGKYKCGFEVEKMSKSKFNVQNPDDLIEKYGADTLRMYEMFLGPIEQSKPWDIKGITGVNSFLKKLWRLFHDSNNNVDVSDTPASKDELRALHKAIKKIRDDLNRYSFNTCVSTMMILVNELSALKSNTCFILNEVTLLLAPFAPHISEELWELTGNTPGSLTIQKYPIFDESHLLQTSYSYPVSFNGKMRFKKEFSLELKPNEIESLVLEMQETKKWIAEKQVRKVIVVPGKIVNIVLS
ncbi:MAG: leucine--tRNA ligase [Crocinitomicaceae bacterium]|nr:leucine--tRNA ligase [Crocinitomicaceae bacterium]